MARQHQVVDRVFHLGAAPGEETLKAIQPLLEPHLEMATYNATENLLTVSALPATLARIEALLSELTRTPKQYEIEVQVVEVSKNALRQMGSQGTFGLDVRGGVLATTFPLLGLGDSRRYLPAPGDLAALSRLGTANGVAAATEPGTFSDSGFRFGHIDGRGIGLLIQFLEQSGEARVMATPKVTALDNRRARISMVTTLRIPTFTQNQAFATTTVTGIEQVDVGTTLDVCPRSGNGRQILLTVTPEVSELQPNSSAFTENGLTQGLPIVTRRRTETEVILDSGETLIIGGLVTERKTETHGKTPAELALLGAGGPLDLALDRLGLEITAASIRGSQARSADLEAALRADAAAQSATTDALKKTRRRVEFFALALAGLSLSTLYLSFVLVPGLIKKSTENLPPNWQAPPALLQFESFRDLWLAVGGGTLLLGVALVAALAGLLGRDRWTAFLQDLRLRLPFLHAHAVQASRARLLEALACEQAAGLPANETLRRVCRREPVPRLAAALALGAARLDAGEPWAGCLRGTLLDAPLLADLAALAGHGARPTKGLQWAAAQSREQAVKGLRLAVGAVAALLLIPAFAYLLLLMHVASVTAAIAQVESIRLEMETLTNEVDQILQSHE